MYKLENVFKNYHDLEVMSDFSIEIPENKITAVLGPSGCGKTSLLNLFAKIIQPDRGEVKTAAKTSYLFQEPRLVPWLTVRDNIALVLTQMNTPILKEQIDSNSVAQLFKRVTVATGITNYINYYPHQLSGGIKQRVAMARAFVYQAPLLLMDEPFKSLDIKTRFKLINDFFGLWKEEPKTVIMVTHDIKEALLLGDRVLVLSDKPCKIVENIDIEANQGTRLNNYNLQNLEERIFKLML